MELFVIISSILGFAFQILGIIAASIYIYKNGETFDAMVKSLFKSK